jgi:uncharacterized membrane protein
MNCPRLLFAAVVMTALGGAASAQQRTIEFCSAGQKAWRVALAHDTAGGRRVEGWHAVPLGACAKLTVPADVTLYYFGESTDSERIWPPPGLGETRYCVQPRKDKFFYVIPKNRLAEAHKASRCPDDALGPRFFIFHFSSMQPRIDMPY